MTTIEQIKRDLDELYYRVNNLSGGGVASVKGNVVDNTDPNNPVVTAALSVVRNTLPTVFDDDTQGFTVGSRIFVPDDGNGFVNAEYICTDNTTGAAVWVPAEGYYSFVGLVEIVAGGGVNELQVVQVLKNTLPTFTISGGDGDYGITANIAGSYANMVHQSGVFDFNITYNVETVTANTFRLQFRDFSGSLHASITHAAIIEIRMPL